MSGACDTVEHEAEDKFYIDAIQYWSEIPATVDGMLGGFGSISQTDIQGSRMFLKRVFKDKPPPGSEYVLDCGAGIGRISKHLLSYLFTKVDLVEQNPAFLEEAKDFLAPLQTRIGKYICCGLQNFVPEREKYDVIWIQWVLGHLTDEDLVKFLRSCQIGLKKNGMIIVKENVTSSDELDEDNTDSSVTRPLGSFRKIFAKADLECYRTVLQAHFPKGLYNVYMFALRPKIDSSQQENSNQE